MSGVLELIDSIERVHSGQPQQMAQRLAADRAVRRTSTGAGQSAEARTTLSLRWQ